MDRRLQLKSRRWTVLSAVALLSAGCSGGPVTDDALITNNCDVTILAAVIDEVEFDTAVWLDEYALLSPGESQVFTRPNFDGGLVLVSVLLYSDDEVYTSGKWKVGDLSTVEGESTETLLFDVQIEGDLCPVEP